MDTPNFYVDTDPDSRHYGERMVDFDGETYTYAAFLDREVDEDAVDQAIDAALPAPAPPPAPTPKVDAAVARHIAKRRVLTTKMLLDMPEPDWFIEKLIPHSPRLVIHGQPGSKKSFLALDLAVCLEHDLPWHGRKVDPGKVFFIVGEGVQGMSKRLQAVAHGKNMNPEDIKVTWMAEPLNLHTADAEQIDLWARFVRHFDFKYIVVDTLHMNSAGMDENSSKEMGEALDKATKIAGGATSGRMVIFIHHNTKTGGMRGSSSLEGDCDTILEMKKTGELTSKIKSVKLRDAAGFDNLELTFREHGEDGSLYIATAGSAQPAVTHVDRILNVLRAEPFTHTKSAVVCMLGGTGAVDKAWKRCVEEEWIVSEIRPTTAKRGPKMVDTWAVDEDNVPLIPGVPDAAD